MRCLVVVFLAVCLQVSVHGLYLQSECPFGNIEERHDGRYCCLTFVNKDCYKLVPKQTHSPISRLLQLFGDENKGTPEQVAVIDKLKQRAEAEKVVEKLAVIDKLKQRAEAEKEAAHGGEAAKIAFLKRQQNAEEAKEVLNTLLEKAKKGQQETHGATAKSGTDDYYGYGYPHWGNWGWGYPRYF